MPSLTRKTGKQKASGPDSGIYWHVQHIFWEKKITTLGVFIATIKISNSILGISCCGWSLAYGVYGVYFETVKISDISSNNARNHDAANQHLVLHILSKIVGCHDFSDIFILL